MVNVITTENVKELLIHDYEEGDFYLSSPSGTMLGKGIMKIMSDESELQHNRLSEGVKLALEAAKTKGISNPVAVGAIPFDPKNNVPQFFIPESVKFSKPDYMKDAVQDSNSSLDTYEMQSIPLPQEYMEGVQKGLDYIKDGKLDKIVLARSVKYQSKSEINKKKILENLVQYNTGGYTFAIDLMNEISAGDSKGNGKRTFMGASPELLVSKTDNKMIANPLAGSRPRSEDPIEDKRRAKELLQSAKDLHEHAVVVEAIREELKSLCTNLIVPEKPSVIKTETMWHLSTVITGELVDSNATSLDLALALHPTPAVCGYPRENAYQAINEIEPFDRNYFTGVVGWCDEAGNGEWIVAIRCAEIEKNSISLFAGAGIVAGSEPEEELKETSAKMRTMINAMGLQDA